VAESITLSVYSWRVSKMLSRVLDEISTAAYNNDDTPQYDKCQLPIGYVPPAVEVSSSTLDTIFDTLQE
jgi:hypothetical protein